MARAGYGDLEVGAETSSVQAVHPVGSAAAPGIAFSTDTDVGLYRVDANQLGISVGGTGQLAIIDGVLQPITTNDIDLGTASLQFKNAWFDGTLEADAITVGGVSVATGTNATTVTTTANNADETVYPTFVDGTSSSQDIEVDTGLTYNPSSGLLTITGELDAGSLDISGNADIDGTLEADAITIDTVTLAEYISDTVGAMVSCNTESGITVAYQDADNTIDFTVGTLNQNTTGSAATLTCARCIGGVSFNGSTSINLPGVNTAGNQNTSGSAATLTNARDIGGVSFNGSASINLPGVNTAGCQNTSGTAAVGTTTTVSANNTADETVYLTFVDAATGNKGLETDTGLNYNPCSGALTATSFTGSVTGTITGTTSCITVTTVNDCDTVYPVFVDGGSGSQAPEVDTGLTYNPATGLLTSAGFAGPIDGNLTGTLQTASQANVTTLAGLTSLGAAGATTNVVAGDVTMYNAVNNGNPTISLGSSSAERLTITANYTSGAQLLCNIKFATIEASSTANRGKYVFDVDGTDILTIDDGGIDIASGKTFAINGSDIAITDTTYTAGDGLTLTGTDIDLDAALTTVTSILATDVKIGEDNETKVDFADANIINLHANNIKALSVHNTSSKGELRFYEGCNYVGFAAPALDANQIWTLPAADGSCGQALTTDSCGVLSWASAGGAVSAINNATANEIVTVGACTSELCAEANLTFTGSLLTVTGNLALTNTDGGSSITRSTSSTTGLNSPFVLTATSTGNAADTFGPAIEYKISDCGVGATRLGVIGIERNGADNTGQFHVNLDSGGTLATRFSVNASGQALHANGCASTPAISFTNDNDSGFFRADSNNIGVAAGGSERMRFSNSKFFVEDTLNGNQSIGITINQEANDDEILALKSSDVGASGNYSGVEADTYALFKKRDASGGGLSLMTFNHGLGNQSFYVEAYAAMNRNAPTTGGTGANGVIHMRGYEFDDTGTNSTANCLEDGEILFVAAQGGTASVVFTAAGTISSNASATVGTFDSYDDALMLRAMDTVVSPGCIIQSRWDDYVTYNEQSLIDAGIFSGRMTNDDGTLIDPHVKERGMWDITQHIKLLNGAAWQLWTELQETKEEIGAMKVQLALTEGK